MRTGFKSCQTWSNDQIRLADNPAVARTNVRVVWHQLSGALTALALLALLLPGPARWPQVLGGAAPGSAAGNGASSAGESAVLLVAAALVWILLFWGSTVAIVALAGRLPGRAGRGGRAVLARIAPGLARKCVLTAVGASMVTGLVACGAGPEPAPSPGAGSCRSAPLDVVRSSIERSTDVAMSRPVLARPASSGTPVEGSAVQLRSDLSDHSAWSEVGPAEQVDIDWPMLPAGSGLGPGKNPVDIDWPDSPSPVVVLAGDSLWSIAARHLAADAGDGLIQQATREWYAANTSVIGDNPNLILPGQILRPPKP
jgi:hypothetical protein